MAAWSGHAGPQEGRVVDEPAIADDVRFAACHSVVVTPDPPEGSAAVVVRRGSWVLLMTAMPTVSFVDPFDVSVAALPDVVDDVREALRRHGRQQAAWTVPAGSDLHRALADAGMTPYVDSPLEPTEWCMAIVGPPQTRPAEGVVVRMATTQEDYLAGAELAGDVFDMSPTDRVGLREAWLLRQRLAAQGLPTGYSFLAYVDDRLVGYANAQPNDYSVALFGGGVLPGARGRGIYSALVAARWDYAVDVGTPALTVGAGAMSRPRLQRLGFQVVAEQAVLKDQLSR
jgi:GNAT superfamily N-acetyltransferase